MIDPNAIFHISSEDQFRKLTLEIFKYQFENNMVYRSFCDLLNVHSSDVKVIDQIPFLPIQFFKTHQVTTSNNTEKIFESSGTTGSVISKHFVTDISLYEKSFSEGFKHFYGDIEDYVILALLPNYLEREGSSLIYMVDNLIKKSNHPESGFYLNNYSELSSTLNSLESRGKKSILIGVSFALLDLIERFQFNLKHTIIMETGGMKGRRKELIREELHEKFKKGFGVPEIHSEYGMTELLSQAYSKGESQFESPNWMRILIRDTEDAMTIMTSEKTGGINIIDLANIHSCSFIAAQDLGKKNTNNTFEILGRFDHSDIRGCNLMVI